MSDKVVVFSNEDEVIARFKEDWRGRSGYNQRKGRLPDFYTEGMKYYGRVIDNKLVGVTGMIDKEDYVILGGTWIHPQYRRDTPKHKEHGSSWAKIKMRRENEIRGRPKIAGFRFTGEDKSFEQEWIDKNKKIFTLDSHEDIPEEMVNQFRERYGDAWGIAKMFTDYGEREWKNILKRW